MVRNVTTNGSERERRRRRAASYAFNEFLLDCDRRTLYRDGEPLELSNPALLLLTALIDNRDRVLTYDEIEALVWKGRNVEAVYSIHTAVSAIRRALQDDARAPRYIQTIPREGYRFLSPVSRVGARDRADRKAAPGIAVVALLALVVAAPAFLLRQNVATPTDEPPLVESSNYDPLGELLEQAFESIWQDEPAAARNLIATTESVRGPEAESVVDAMAAIHATASDQEQALQASKLLRHALNVAPRSAYANAVYARFLAFHELDLVGAREHADRALRADVQNPEAYTVKAYLAAAETDLTAAVEYAGLAARFAPNSSHRMAEYGVFLGRARRFDEAVGACRGALDLNEENRFAVVCLFFVHWRNGDFDAARRYGMRLIEDRAATQETLTSLDGLDNDEFFRAFWDSLLQYYESSEEIRDVRELNLAVIHASLGNTAQATQYLRTAMEDPRARPYALWMQIDPHIDSIRTDAEFLSWQAEWQRAIQQPGVVSRGS